jgi:hypothetical protein
MSSLELGSGLKLKGKVCDPKPPLAMSFGASASSFLLTRFNQLPSGHGIGVHEQQGDWGKALAFVWLGGLFWCWGSNPGSVLLSAGSETELHPSPRLLTFTPGLH